MNPEKNHTNIINFFWIGAEVSPVEILSFNSCLKNNMVPMLWCYEEIKNLPEGVISRDANENLNQEKIK